MTTTTWEKSGENNVAPRAGIERLKFMIGGVLMLAAVAILMLSGTLTGAQYFISVDELVTDPAYVGETVRISGAVDGNSIQYDEENLILNFSVSAIDTSTQNIALELHNAVNDSSRSRIWVHIEGEVKPDLLQHEAQAIMTGTMGEDGIFYATELLLKCPSRYGEAVPDQVEGVANAG